MCTKVSFFFLTAFAAPAAVLAGCSSANAPSDLAAVSARAPGPVASPAFRPPQGPKPAGWISRDALDRHLVYAADGGAVAIFPERGHNPKAIGYLTDGIESAYGLCVDRYGNLYVANQYGDSVEEYPRGYMHPTKTYSQDLERPLYPIVDSSGDLWVGNADNGTVVEFASGSTSVKQVLQTAGTEADGMDFDQQGNLYVAFRNYYYSSGYSGSIEEFPAGSSKGTILGMNLNQPQGLIVTNTGTILAVETGSSDRIDVFPPGYKTPTYEDVLTNDTPTQIAIDAAEHNLFVSTLGGYIYSSAYPLVNPNGSPNKLHERIEVGGTSSYYPVQGMTLSNSQVF